MTPWTVARQAPLSMGFPRQEYWSGLPFPPPGILLTQGWNPHLLHCRWSLALQAFSCISLPAELPGKPILRCTFFKVYSFHSGSFCMCPVYDTYSCYIFLLSENLFPTVLLFFIKLQPHLVVCYFQPVLTPVADRKPPDFDWQARCGFATTSCVFSWQKLNSVGPALIQFKLYAFMF